MSSKKISHSVEEDLVDYENDEVIELSPLNIIKSSVVNDPSASISSVSGAAAAAGSLSGIGTPNGLDSSSSAKDATHGIGEYDSSLNDDITAASNKTGAHSGPKDGKGSYVGIHATNFRDFLLKPELQRAINDSGYEHPSEVQQEAICKAMFGNDILCQAKSGMGKTAVFVLSTLQQIDESLPTEPLASLRVIVLCHTRELAYQIKQEYCRFSTYMPGFAIEAVFGGTRIDDDVKRIQEKQPKILVATPGRIHALIRGNKISLRNVKHFVLDECDKLLESVDMRSDVQQIFKACPHQKQVMMFSATLNSIIKPICKRFMVNPIEIYVDSESKLTLHGLKQYYKTLGENEKNKLLTKLLDDIDFNQCYIFVRTTRRADALSKLLEGLNFPAITIHSDIAQDERLRRYSGFKNMEKRIMVATDVMGRGIDVERVNLVINYDMSDSRETYLHRVGRAGRFGTKGVAITFISSPNDTDVLNDVQLHFEVNVEELPEKIERAFYMNNPEGAPTAAPSTSASATLATKSSMSGKISTITNNTMSSSSSNASLPEVANTVDSGHITLNGSPRKTVAPISAAKSSYNNITSR